MYYSSADPEQLKRLRQYARVRRYTGGRIKCEKAFFNYNLDIIDNVEADEYIAIIHYDALAMHMRPNTHPKITKYVGVSELVCESFRQTTGLEIECCYNPIALEKPRKYLRLVSATRLTAEKGKDRMRMLADMLDNEGVAFEWIVYTNDTQCIDNPHIFYRKPVLGIEDAVANADYLVQLSDGEGYCFSVVEALMLGTPVIVTDCPVYKELGLQDGKNAFVLPFDLSKVPIKAIAKGLPKPKFIPPQDSWGKLLAKGEREQETDKVSVQVRQQYYDLVFNKMLFVGEEFETDYERATYLYGLGLVEL